LNDKSNVVNEHIEVPDPYKDYNKYVDSMLKNNPEMAEMGRLCYEIFMQNKDGQLLLKSLEERYIYVSHVNPKDTSAPTTALYWSGFTDCIKGLKMYATEHKKRISECQD
jgi:hypothetical protein